MSMTTGSKGGFTTQNDVTASRAFNTNYTNTSGKPFLVLVQLNAKLAGTAGDVAKAIALVNAATVATVGIAQNTGVAMIYLDTDIILSFFVPSGQVYRVNNSIAVNGTITITKWIEVR